MRTIRTFRTDKTRFARIPNRPVVVKKVTLSTGYVVEIMTLHGDPHPDNVTGRTLIMGLLTNTGREKGMIGIPLENWAEVRRELDKAYRGMIGDFEDAG
jgi:hypothetical protein